jgi:hypothetical protein
MEKLFPSIILAEKDVRKKIKNILEILELNIQYDEENELIILKPPRKNSSKNHKAIYELFYKAQTGGK